jgi:hypothetical protein
VTRDFHPAIAFEQIIAFAAYLWCTTEVINGIAEGLDVIDRLIETPFPQRKSADTNQI